jgi:hypothetical protein
MAAAHLRGNINVENIQMIRSVKELSADQRMAVESLLGRSIAEDEQTIVRAVSEPPEWLQKAWRGAKERGVDQLTREDIQVEIDAYRRESPQRINGDETR